MKLNLGKTPEEQAAEEAKKQKERELEIQRAHIERQHKIEALHRKQKTNKIIIISVSSLLIIALGVFGTYNTFFKKDINIDDVKNQIYTQVIAYPSEGLDNYIRDISQTLFNEHIGFDGNKYISAEIDKNSVYISRVKKTNNIFSQVYFMADVIMTERDSRVTDQNIIDILKKGGLRTTTTSTSTIENNVTSSDTMSSEQEENNSFNENTSINTSTSMSSEEVLNNTNNNVTIGSGIKATDYYLNSDGSYMQKGKKTIQRYTFMVPVEYYYNYNEQNVAISSGYKTAGKMELYSLQEVDIFTEAQTTHEYYEFNKDYLVDEATLISARQTVNKIFADIYAGTVLPQDFINARKFNTYGAKYIRLDDFAFYTVTNPMGYNAVATYTIELPQGFNYTTTVYLTVEPNNTTWKITNMT